MSDKQNAIMIAIGKAKAKPGLGSSPDVSDDDNDSDSGGPSEDEVSAMRAFSSAKTDEEKADALKTFIQLCTSKDY